MRPDGHGHRAPRLPDAEQGCDRPAGPAAPLALVVEDDTLQAMAVEDLLAGEGFATAVAGTSDEALAWAGADLAVAVVDLGLAEGVVGQRVIRFLRRRARPLPVVVLTGYDPRAPEADLRGVGGPTARLRKPPNFAELARAVREVMDRARTGAAPHFRRRASDG